MRRYNVCIVHQSVWNSELLSVPLGAGYLKAYAEQDDYIRKNFNINILNFNCSHSNKYILKMITQVAPDILCFSIFGWNINNFINIGQAYKDLNSKCTIVIGGVHVSFQDKQVFSKFPCADILINGEGEITFVELLKAYAKGLKDNIYNVPGLTIKVDNEIVSTPKRAIIKDLNIIPSPYLSGAIPLRDKDGATIYDSALLETGRGCPFSCAYCSWNSGSNKVIRRFSEKRLIEELELFAFYKIDNVVLCDSNFGMSVEDEHFAECFIKTKEKYGFPRNLEASWTKIISPTTLSILEKLKSNKIKQSFSISIQSQNQEALKNINRQGITLKELDRISKWTQNHGMEFFIELIWGLPGETTNSFVENVNQLSMYTKKMAVYPLVILPTSTLAQKKQEFNFKTVKESDSDFEYCISNYSLTFEENSLFTNYIFWLRITSENMIFRNIWKPLDQIIKMKFFDVIKSFTEFILHEKTINLLHKNLRNFTIQADIHNTIPNALEQIYYNQDELNEIILLWWKNIITKSIPESYKEFFRELIQYELLTLPISNITAQRKQIETINYDDDSYYIIKNITFHFDFLSQNVSLCKKTSIYDFYYKVGFEKFMYNQEFINGFLGRPRLTSQSEFAELSHARMLG